MNSVEQAESDRLISKEVWARIKSGAAVTGLAVATIAICAVSTFACAYATAMGFAKGTKDAEAGVGSGLGLGRTEANDRGYSAPTGFRRNVFDREDAA